MIRSSMSDVSEENYFRIFGKKDKIILDNEKENTYIPNVEKTFEQTKDYGINLPNESANG